MNEFADPNKLLATLGSFWYSYYDNYGQVRDLLNSVAKQDEIIDDAVDELENSLSRHNIDIFRKKRWVEVKVKYSEYLETAKIYAKYDGDYTYNGELIFDQYLYTKFRIAIPDNIVSIGSICDKLIDPSVVWDDITIDEHTIILPENPFNGQFYTESIYDDKGHVIDTQITLWLLDVEEDHDDLYTQFGYAINLKLPSSQQYKDLINAVMDTLVNGPSKAAMAIMLSIFTGIPVVRNQEETVKHVGPNYVDTDKEHYEFSENDVILVSEGDILHRGDTMTEGFQINSNDIEGIALDKNFIPVCLDGSIFFPNKEEEAVITKENGLLRYDLPVIGDHRFLDIIATNGLLGYEQITDECEIQEINRLLGRYKQYDNEEPVVNVISNTGLSNYVRTKRFI